MDNPKNPDPQHSVAQPATQQPVEVPLAEAEQKRADRPVVVDAMGKPMPTAVRAELDRRQTEADQNQSADPILPFTTAPNEPPPNQPRPPVRTNQPVTPTVHPAAKPPEKPMRDPTPVDSALAAKFNGMIQDHVAMTLRREAYVAKHGNGRMPQQVYNQAVADLKKAEDEMRMKQAEIERTYADMISKFGYVAAAHVRVQSEHTAYGMRPIMAKPHYYAAEECPPVPVNGACAKCGWSADPNNPMHNEPHPVSR